MQHRSTERSTTKDQPAARPCLARPVACPLLSQQFASKLDHRRRPRPAMPTTLWPYVYKTLSKPEQATRRLALDAAGHSIIYTQLLLGTLLFVYLGLTRRWCRASPVARTLRRLEWRLKVPIAVTMPYWRCWGDWMIMAAWASYCLGVAMRNTGDGMSTGWLGEKIEGWIVRQRLMGRWGRLPPPDQGARHRGGR